jgi:hypothetical protein
MATELDTNSMLEKVLSYADKPWKVAAILVMAAAGFLGYFAYSEKDLLIGAYVESKKLPAIDQSRVDEVARLVQKRTGAVMVTIFEVNPIIGTRKPIIAIDRDGAPNKGVKGKDIGLFTASEANNKDVVSLMAGAIPCNPYPAGQSEIGLWYKDIGVNYVCKISVPPDPSRFIGQITVGFEQEPKDLDQVRSILVIAGQMLTQKGN